MVSTYEPKEYSPTHLYEAQSSRSTVGRLRAIKVVKATKGGSVERAGWKAALHSRVESTDLLAPVNHVVTAATSDGHET
eukprot:438457-Prorocentrum_minimum.AAC.2